MNDKDFLQSWVLYRSTKKRDYDSVIGYAVPNIADTIAILDAYGNTRAILSQAEFLRWIQLANVTVQPPCMEYDDDDAKADKRRAEYDKRNDKAEVIAAMVQAIQKLADKL